MPNVVAVLAGVHNFGHPALAGRSIHGNPGWSAGLGLLLSPLSPHPPASRAVRHWRHGWVWLLPEGSYLPVSGPGQGDGGAGSPPAPPFPCDAIAPGVIPGSPRAR